MEKNISYVKSRFLQHSSYQLKHHEEKHRLVKKAVSDVHQGLTFLASCVKGLVPAKSVNQLLMELCDLAVTSQKLSFWLTCGLRFPVSGNVLQRSFSAIMLLKFELICKALRERCLTANSVTSTQTETPRVARQGS